MNNRVVYYHETYARSNLYICVDIDQLVPCLVNGITGEMVETEVIKVSRKSFLSKFNTRNGWYTNWGDLTKNCDIYALVVKGSVDIQGLVAMDLEQSTNMNAGFIAWAVAAVWNNPELVDQKRYVGVGGHLLAIASDWSINHGHDGVMTGYCRNVDIMNHFITAYDAEHIDTGLHPFHIVFEQEPSQKIREVYDYEWTDDEL